MATSAKNVMQWQRLMFSTGSICFPPTVVVRVEGSTHGVQVNCIFFSIEQYLGGANRKTSGQSTRQVRLISDKINTLF